MYILSMLTVRPTFCSEDFRDYFNSNVNGEGKEAEESTSFVPFILLFAFYPSLHADVHQTRG